MSHGWWCSTSSECDAKAHAECKGETANLQGETALCVCTCEHKYRQLTVMVAGQPIKPLLEKHRPLGAEIYTIRTLAEQPDYGPMEFRDREGNLIPQTTLVGAAPDFMYLTRPAGVGG